MKLIYNEHEGQGTWVESYAEATQSDFLEKLSAYVASGYTEFEKRIDKNSFLTLKRGDDMVLLAYYPTVSELRVVTEPDSSYFSFSDTPCKEKVEPEIIQVDLEDFGMSYIVRLSDGRFIVIDGGFEFDPDADSLMRCLAEQTPHDKPIIAAWIMTHAHVDHYRCYLTFEKKYSDRVKIERFIYNFSDPVIEPERLPDMVKRVEHVSRFFDAVKKTGAPVYKAHTGQVYKLGGVKMEILSSPDDTFLVPVRDFNIQSLVIKMTAAGQDILWAADCYFKSAKLAERYGDYLKADIFQAPHHLFIGGEKEAYALIDPHTCLIPSFEEHVFGSISMYNLRYSDIQRFLLFDLHVHDVFAGGNGDVILKLPYTPRENGRQIILEKYASWQRRFGAFSWFFDGLTKEDCSFTVINPINERAVIFADLIFEDSKNSVNSIKIEIPKHSFKKINLMNPEDADPDALARNPSSLSKKGIPDGAEFVVQFKSNMPVVIVGKKEAAYKG